MGGACAGTGVPMPARAAAVAPKARALVTCCGNIWAMGWGSGVWSMLHGREGECVASSSATSCHSYEQTGCRETNQTEGRSVAFGTTETRRTCASGPVATCFSKPTARAPRSTRAIEGAVMSRGGAATDCGGGRSLRDHLCLRTATRTDGDFCEI